MTQNDRNNFNEIMLLVFTSFGKQPDDKLIDLYFTLLSEHSFEKIKEAIGICLKTLKFFPKLAEIIELIEGKKENIIEFSFENAKNMINTCGFHNSIIMKDKISMLVIRDFGGLQSFSERIYENEKDTYFSWKRMYERYLEMDRIDGRIPEIKNLIGYMEQLGGENRHGGTYQTTFWDKEAVKTLPQATPEAVKYLQGVEDFKKQIGIEIPKKIENNIEIFKADNIEEILEKINFVKI